MHLSKSEIIESFDEGGMTTAQFKAELAKACGGTNAEYYEILANMSVQDIDSYYRSNIK